MHKQVYQARFLHPAQEPANFPDDLKHCWTLLHETTPTHVHLSPFYVNEIMVLTL